MDVLRFLSYVKKAVHIQSHATIIVVRGWRHVLSAYFFSENISIFIFI